MPWVVWPPFYFRQSNTRQHVILWLEGNHISKWRWVCLFKLPDKGNRAATERLIVTEVVSDFLHCYTFAQSIFLTFCFWQSYMFSDINILLSSFVDIMDETFTTLMTTETNYYATVSVNFEYLSDAMITVKKGTDNVEYTDYWVG